MDATFMRETVLFVGLYVVALVGAGALAALTREIPLGRYLVAVWTDPIWLLGVTVGMGLWLLIYNPNVGPNWN